MTSKEVSILFLVFLIMKFTIKIYLDLRNKEYINKHSKEVPNTFRDKVELADHQKAALYSSSKINFGLVSGVIGTLVLLGWTLGGGLNYIDEYAKGFNQGNIATGLICFGLFAIVSMLISLPESLYSTFVLEEKFGFNKTTPKTFIVDMIKGTALGILIGGPILTGILWIMEKLGTFWWVYAWAFLCIIQVLMLWLYPTLIAPIFNKFTEMEEGEVKEKVLKLLEKTGFTSKGLFVMDASIRSSHGNAYFTGFGQNKRIVFFDTLIKTLTPGEVEAVLAHELGHFKMKHVLKNIAKSFIFSLIGFAILGQLIQSQSFFNGHGVQNVSIYMGLLLFSMVSDVYTFLITPINSLSSRKHEFEADAFAAKYSNASELISALVKLYKDNASTLTPDPLYSKFYHSHPPALIRVEHLDELKDHAL